jgi:hemerythrin
MSSFGNFGHFKVDRVPRIAGILKRLEMKIDWKDSYKIGNADIDAEHEMWFEVINRFLEATDKESLVLCETQMYRYTQVHFAHEEKLMRRINYPGIRDHIEQHNALVAKLYGITLQIASDTLDRNEWRNYLSSWLIKHIATTDTRLAAYVQSEQVALI